MICSNPEGETPSIGKSTFMDPTALLIGDVSIGENVFVEPYAVIRADELGSEVVIEGHCKIRLWSFMLRHRYLMGVLFTGRVV